MLEAEESRETGRLLERRLCRETPIDKINRIELGSIPNLLPLTILHCVPVPYVCFVLS